MRYLGQKDQVAMLNGSLEWVGTIVATTTKNNADTAVPFTLLANRSYLLQPDTAGYVATVSSASGTVTAANGLLLEAGEKYRVTMLEGVTSHIAALAVSGTCNVKVFLLK